MRRRLGFDEVRDAAAARVEKVRYERLRSEGGRSEWMRWRRRPWRLGFEKVRDMREGVEK